MKRFSQRKGIVSVNTAFQVDSMDTDLRNGLWNALAIHYWERMGVTLDPEYRILLNRLWLNFFKLPLEGVPRYGNDAREALREYFYGCTWYEVYDFIEFVANSFRTEYINEQFVTYCNAILERELSAYRFVDGLITQVTDQKEIETIEEAINVPVALRPVAVHLRRALELLSDRKSPDYRNSIKEAISAVETMSNLMNGARASLGDALDRLGQKVKIHPALKKGFESLYGWTSDADGIRHALMDEPNLTFEDAKFMLVSCSAFTTYLRAKGSAAAIKFS